MIKRDSRRFDSGNFEAALKKIPLPPETGPFEIHGNDTTHFYIIMKFSDRGEAEIAAYYRACFKDNGWVSRFSPGKEPDGLLDFRKGKANINVKTITIPSGIQVMVIYREDEHTRDEFDRLVHDSATPEASRLARRIAGAYGALRSYADSGAHQSNHDGNARSTAAFKTHYVAPDKLRFEYSEILNGWFHSTYVLSKLGDSVQTASSVGTMPEIENDISLAIASFYGVTSATSGNIPELLLGMGGRTLVHLAGLKLLDEATADDGTPCLRLHGKDFISHQLTIWIGKDDLMIRKIESVEDDSNHETTTYSPKINIEIAEEALAFKKPVART